MINNSPFKDIPHDPTSESIKVWDFSAFDYMHNEGRIRILAVVPKKPNPLNNIKFAVSYCAPADLKKFTKKKSNNILVGRFMASFGPDRNGLARHTGVISVDTLENFPFQVINSFGETRPFGLTAF